MVKKYFLVFILLSVFVAIAKRPVQERSFSVSFDSSVVKEESKKSTAKKVSIIDTIKSIKSDTNQNITSDSIKQAVLVQTQKDTLKVDTIKNIKTVVESAIVKQKSTDIIKKIEKPKLTLKVSGPIKISILIISIFFIIGTILFFRSGMEKSRFMTTTRLSIMDKEVQRACRFIESNFENPELSIDLLCKELVTGPAFVRALFDRDLGITVEDFISQVRINRAKIILDKDPSTDITLLASSIGLANEKELIDLFERLTDMKFSDYKNSLLTRVTS